LALEHANIDIFHKLHTYITAKQLKCLIFMKINHSFLKNSPMDSSPPAQPGLSKKQTSKVLFPLLVINFIGSLGFSLVLPFLIYLVRKFGGNDVLYGFLGATYPLFQLIGAPILGNWSDRVGRKKVLLLSQLGTLLSWVIFLIAFFVPTNTLFNLEHSLLGAIAFTLPLALIFFARAFDGLTGGNISVANAYLGDISTEKNRKANFGKMSASANLGFILGPTLAGLLGGTAMGEKLPVLAALIISVIGSLLIVFMLPAKQPMAQQDTLQQDPGNAPPSPENHKHVGWKEIFKIPNIPVMLVLNFFIFLGFNVFYTAFPIHAASTLEWSITTLGIFFSVLSGWMLVVQGPILTWISNRVSDEKLTVIGLFLLAINFVMLTSMNPIMVWGSVFFFGLGNGLMWPSFLSILSRLAGPRYQGAVQGFSTSSGSLASIVGLLLGGFMYQSIQNMAFGIAAGVIFFVFILCLRLLVMKVPHHKAPPAKSA